MVQDARQVAGLVMLLTLSFCCRSSVCVIHEDLLETMLTEPVCAHLSSYSIGTDSSPPTTGRCSADSKSLTNGRNWPAVVQTTVGQCSRKAFYRKSQHAKERVIQCIVQLTACRCEHFWLCILLGHCQAFTICASLQQHHRPALD